MDTRWIKTLTPDEARAALNSLDARRGPYTVNEILELRKLRLALQAKANPET
jgi:hypothetical protein